MRDSQRLCRLERYRYPFFHMHLSPWATTPPCLTPLGHLSSYTPFREERLPSGNCSRLALFPQRFILSPRNTASPSITGVSSQEPPDMGSGLFGLTTSNTLAYINLPAGCPYWSTEEMLPVLGLYPSNRLTSAALQPSPIACNVSESEGTQKASIKHTDIPHSP